MLDVFSRKNACKVGPRMLGTLNIGQLLVEIGTFLGFIEPRYTKLPGVKRRATTAKHYQGAVNTDACRSFITLIPTQVVAITIDVIAMASKITQE